jgi:hypothetical protein
VFAKIKEDKTEAWGGIGVSQMTSENKDTFYKQIPAVALRIWV